MKHLYLLGVAALIVAAPVSAQRPDSTMRHPAVARESGRRGAPMMMARMMMGSPYAPARLLARNGALKLTAQQITALTTLRDATERDAKAAMDRAATHGKELQAAIEAGTDTAAIRAHFTAAHQAMGEARLTEILAGVKARALLTDAQRTQVKDWAARMRRRGGAMMGRGHQMPATPPAKGAPGN